VDVELVHDRHELLRCRARARPRRSHILRANDVGNVSEAVYVNALSLDRVLAYGLPSSEN
jgi:hypothetical protein